LRVAQQILTSDMMVVADFSATHILPADLLITEALICFRGSSANCLSGFGLEQSE
jgi:hypothetical protein